MVHLDDIQSLTEFQRNTRQSIARLRKTGRPAVLTVNGQAEIVVQDATSYQRLLDRAQEADRLMELRRSIAEFRGGRTRDIEAALGDLEARYAVKPNRQRVRSVK